MKDYKYGINSVNYSWGREERTLRNSELTKQVIFVTYIINY